MDKAFHDGDQAIANGSFLTAAGATLGVASTFMGFLAIPGAQILAILGLFVVAGGFIYKLVEGESPMERFFAHCSWGGEHLSPGGGDWSPTRFEEWKGDKEFDYQLAALLNIVCSIEISSSHPSFRTLEYKIGWIPQGAKLTVTYEEKWDGESPRTLSGDISLTDHQATSKQPGLKAVLEGKNIVNVEVDPRYLSNRHPRIETHHLIGNVEFADGLEQSIATGRLYVKLDDSIAVTIPHGQSVEKTLVHGHMYAVN